MTTEKYPAFFDRFTLWLTQDEAEAGSHVGDCTEDIEYLLTTDSIKNQFDTIPAAQIMDELRHYGAWDNKELKDDELNRARMLWIACGNVLYDIENPEE